MRWKTTILHVALTKPKNTEDQGHLTLVLISLKTYALYMETWENVILWGQYLIETHQA
jgi:hypothetical protein